ncbi:MAG: patatin-like phospholipase family protein [Ignavibacteriales bacterium]|nr:patatin-like phospholipase family protein [Ignavibacteriales bacterium]
MDVRDFIYCNEVQQLIVDLKKSDAKAKHYSDLIDDEGNQYVDLVQEGGGVLGIALLGYTYVMEEMGIRFFSLAGTSAGAINTLLFASIGKIEEKKSEKILEILNSKNLFDFVDGPPSVRRLIQSIINPSGILKKIFWFLCSINHLIKFNGLNPGDNFYNWITEILRKNNILSQLQLTHLRSIQPKELKIREGINRSVNDLIPKLKIIAAEIKTETRVIFPEMNELFWDLSECAHPADYVRSSMSIPGFFHPHKVKLDTHIQKEDWIRLVKYNGELPQEAVFVDGGIMSNFPIDVFHNINMVPRLPTFGIRLGTDRNTLNHAGTIPGLLMSIFNSARHVLDYTFILQNPDYEKLICKIDVGNHNWLNFSMRDSDKLDLFIRGAKSAAEFLMKFEWEEYKKIRKSMINN